MGVSTRGLFGVLGRLGPPPPADSDADLLDRFVRTADEAAFAGLVRRHGPMVFAVCRRRLGRDAEDAFQAVFLALATSAAAVRRRASLPGWLYRAAYLVALKAAGRRARNPTAPLPDEVPMPAPPPPAVEAEEVRGAVDAEVAGLPDRLRAVVVLCLLEGRTNAEAAGVLGIPVGTVDSRLHAARKTLQARLTRRGVAVGLGVALDPLLGGPVGAAGPRLLQLISHTVPAVLAEAARPGAGAVPAPITDLARGVTAMTTNVRALSAVGLAVGLLGTAGAGAYYAAAPDPAPAAAAQEPKQDAPPAKKAAIPAAAVAVTLQAAPKSVKGTAAALDELFGRKGQDLSTTPFKEVLDTIEEQTGMIVRVDVAAFRRLEGYEPGDDGFDAKNLVDTIYAAHATIRSGHQFPIRDVLADFLAVVKLPVPCTFQVRGNQLVIVPAYQLAASPGVNPLDPGEYDVSPLSARVRHEQIFGGVVAVSADRKPLADILADLRKQTGANIVLDPRCEAAGGKAALTVTLSDVRLYDALRVIADMAELKLVYAGNIYYVTTAANARTFQPPPPRSPPPGPAPVPAP